MKLCMGLIVNDLNHEVSIIEFVLNAYRFGHIIDEVILVYSGKIETSCLDVLETFVTVKKIYVNDLTSLKTELLERGVDERAVNNILDMSTFEVKGVVTYAKKRNIVLLKALLDQMDVVFFIDSDVHPCVLYSEGECEEIDFVGEHLKFLVNENTAVTTSDYSGYYILPPMRFDGLESFLVGIQKEKALAYMLDEGWASGLKFATASDLRQPFATNKILGGNLAMKLGELEGMPPFFSSHFTLGKETFLTRGEDTVMGLFLKKSEKIIMDIDLKIIHDTFGTYPERPDLLNDSKIKTRLYYASMGWIGRNPFYNWLKGEDVKDVWRRQKESLSIGALELARYTKDDRFLNLVQGMDVALENFDLMVNRYELLMSDWQHAIKNIRRGR